MPQQTTCDVCHRTMLKGERAEPYLTPSRERRMVCALCAPRAQREGWIRESAAPETPTRPARESDRSGLLGRIRRRRVEQGRPPPTEEPSTLNDAEPQPEPEPVEREPPRERAPRADDGHSRARDRRDIRAVPTNAQLKLNRAVEVFNDSEHRRTIAGLARTLGPPQVSAAGSADSAAEVVLTVAWELSWYQYAVDLSDPREPVQLRSRGEELDELAEEARQWNVTVLDDGVLALADTTPGQSSDAHVQEGP